MLRAQPQLASRTHSALVDAHRKHDLAFQGRMLCNVLRPRFLTRQRADELTRLSTVVARVLERAGEHLLASDTLLDLVGASEEERAIWSVDPGYPGFTLTSRLDSFMIDEEPRFVEYNAESPAGIGYTDILSEIFEQLPAMHSWEKRDLLRRFDGCRHLLDTLLWAYRAWGGVGAPSIAIIDWEDVSTRRDFELCAAYFREHNVQTVVADPRRFQYRAGRLWFGDTPITLVYRRVLLHELLEKASEATALLSAYRDGAICMVNSPRSKLLHKKALFALLSDGQLQLDLSAEERSVVDRCIPWTRLLETGTTTYEGRAVDLVPFVLSEQHRLALKPVDDYGGRGVVLGWEATPDEWDRAVGHAVERHYIVQERVPIPESDFPVWEEGELAVIPLLLDTDPLLFRGEVGSILTRISGSALLNVSAGSGSTTPTFVAEED